MRIRTWALAAALALACGGYAWADNTGTAFTYQGLLADNGVPANGNYDFEFSVYTAASGGTLIGGVAAPSSVPVAGGLVNQTFSFGQDSNVFDGEQRWLEVHVRRTGSGGSYTVLAPRQLLTPAPLASGLAMPFQRDVHTGNQDALRIQDLDTGTPIHGITSGTQNAGVIGSGPAGSTGVQGESSTGTGVLGISSDAIGVYGLGATGVQALGSVGVYATATGGAGVFGSSSAYDGLHGETTNYNFAGVAGFGGQFGVYGNGQYYGVRGDGATTGVLGAGPAEGLFAAGDIGATGDKNFVEPHPTDPTKEIKYVTLEGREANTFFRGSAELVNGNAFIEIPEDFRIVTDADGLTVQLTPVGRAANLYCASRSLDGIVVSGSPDVAFDYQVIGIRKASKNFQPIVENRDFVPDSPGEMITAKYLKPENHQRLITNGTLNPDGSINMATVHRLGWDQRPGWTDEPKRETRDASDVEAPASP
jgi:hypothetical protein